MLIFNTILYPHVSRNIGDVFKSVISVGRGPIESLPFPMFCVFACFRLDLLPGTPDVSQLGTLQDP